MVLGINEGLVECATVFVKSEAILRVMELKVQIIKYVSYFVLQQQKRIN